MHCRQAVASLTRSKEVQVKLLFDDLISADFFPQDGSRVLFKLSLEVLEMYALHNATKYREGSVAEEEQCGDIVECFKLLQNLSTKDILDFVDTSGEFDHKT